MSIDVSGLDEVLARLERVPEVLLGALEAAAVQESYNVLTLAIPLTPMDLGTLRRSQFATFPERTETGVESRFGYGGAASAYAYYQHEGRRADGTHVIRNHTEPGTGTHYLARAIEQARPGFEGRVAAHISHFLDEVAR